MKFVLAMVVFCLVAFVLAWGIVLLMHGKPWLLVVSGLVYTALFIKLGCLPKSSH